MKNEKTLKRKNINYYKLLINILAVFGVISIFMFSFSGVNFKKENFEIYDMNKDIICELKKLNKKSEELNEIINQLIEEDNGLYRKMMNFNNIVEYPNSYVIGIENVNDVYKLKEKYFILNESIEDELLSRQKIKNNLKNNNIKYFNKIPIIQPISNVDLICISSPYGVRYHPFYKTAIHHDGIDLSAEVGTNIISTADGVVEKIVYSLHGYGNKVVINHNNGYKTLYAHLDYIKVKKGQKVKQGQSIGKVGNSGMSSGPHLHYEIHYNNKTENPMSYFQTHLTPEDSSGLMITYKPK
jgi:murein DD-endopeptidase MepM/ murein hydrolase activator NlpD